MEANKVTETLSSSFSLSSALDDVTAAQMAPLSGASRGVAAPSHRRRQSPQATRNVEREHGARQLTPSCHALHPAINSELLVTLPAYLHCRVYVARRNGACWAIGYAARFAASVGRAGSQVNWASRWQSVTPGWRREDEGRRWDWYSALLARKQKVIVCRYLPRRPTLEVGE